MAKIECSKRRRKKGTIKSTWGKILIQIITVIIDFLKQQTPKDQEILLCLQQSLEGLQDQQQINDRRATSVCLLFKVNGWTKNINQVIIKRKYMENKTSKIKFKAIRHLLSGPFILGMSIPLVLLDFSMEIYHHVAFPLYGIELVKRSEYIRIDRHKLSYLNMWDKAWCAYCGYANGLMAYAVEIAGQTEKYWCGIKHKKYQNFHVPKHHKDFLEYSDKESYKKRYLSQK